MIIPRFMFVSAIEWAEARQKIDWFRSARCLSRRHDRFLKRAPLADADTAPFVVPFQRFPDQPSLAGAQSSTQSSIRDGGGRGSDLAGVRVQPLPQPRVPQLPGEPD